MLHGKDNLRLRLLALPWNFNYRVNKQKARNMRWTASSFMSGVNTLIRGSSGTKDKNTPKSIQEIRDAMLLAMGSTASDRFAVIQLRVTYADDVEDLWYLRGDVMAAIASQDGEVLAREKVASISEMFVGLVPRALTCKPNQPHR